MSSILTDDNPYILGTDPEELHRLGFQHQVWARFAFDAWERAGFTRGQTILDLGCGPGFASRDLGYIVGPRGKVIAVDRSRIFIEFLNHIRDQHQLSIETIHSEFNELNLNPATIDRAYCRWVLAWVTNPEEVTSKVVNALKPGGVFVMHEYLDWKSFSTVPFSAPIRHALDTAINSYKASGDIDIGRRLPEMLSGIGMEITSLKPLNRIARPDSMVWHWPKTFMNIYFPKLVENGLLKREEYEEAMRDWDRMEELDHAFCHTPAMIEIIATRR